MNSQCRIKLNATTLTLQAETWSAGHCRIRTGPRYLKAFITLAMCCGSLISHAVTNEQAQSIFEAVANAAQRGSDSYLTVVDQSEPHPHIAEVRLRGGCTVTVVSTFLEKSNPNEFAAVVGHELAHCVLRHTGSKYVVQNQEEAWPREYDADMLGVELAQKAGYEGGIGLRLVLMNTTESATHPSGSARIAALNGKEREYKAVINIRGLREANALVSVDGKVILSGPRK